MGKKESQSIEFKSGWRDEYLKMICGTSNRTATRDLTELVSKKILMQKGTTGRGTEYVLRRQNDAKDAINAPVVFVFKCCCTTAFKKAVIG